MARGAGRGARGLDPGPEALFTSLLHVYLVEVATVVTTKGPTLVAGGKGVNHPL